MNYFFKVFITVDYLVFAWPSEGNFVNNGGGMTKRGGNIEWKSRCVSLDFSCAMCIFKLSCMVKVIFFIIIKKNLKKLYLVKDQISWIS